MAKKLTKVEKELYEIAHKHCLVETLQTRNSDDLDFSEIAVWTLKAALEAAYEAGKNAK